MVVQVSLRIPPGLPSRHEMERVPIDLTPAERKRLQPLVEATQREQHEFQAVLAVEHGWEALDTESRESALKALLDSLDEDARRQLVNRWLQTPHLLALGAAIQKVFNARSFDGPDWSLAWSLGPEGLRLEAH